MSDSLWPMAYIVHWITQARILEWITFPFSRGSSQPMDQTQVSCNAGGFFTNWATGKPKDTEVGSLSLLKQTFPIQESNWGILHCRWILYQLSYQGSLITQKLSQILGFHQSPYGHSYSDSILKHGVSTYLSDCLRSVFYFHQLSNCSVQFCSFQSLSHAQLFATPWIAARQASLSITNSRSSLRLTSIESVMPSSHLILCHPLLLLPPIPPSLKVFSNESTFHMRWPKYWSFSFRVHEIYIWVLTLLQVKITRLCVLEQVT